MSTHPNVVLVCCLTPDGLSRKTMADIFAESNTNDNAQIQIGGKGYDHIVMESDYDEGWQLSAKEGDLLIFDLVTYGYGDSIGWQALQEQKQQLEEWSKGICERHHCKADIRVTANYW